MLNAVRTFIQTLIDEGHPENLAFTIVAVDDDATNFGTYIHDGSGTDLDDFDIIGGSSNLDGLLTTWDIPHTGGSTNYNAALDAVFSGNGDYLSNDTRSAARRVGKECFGTSRSRVSPLHYKKKTRPKI